MAGSLWRVVVEVELKIVEIPGAVEDSGVVSIGKHAVSPVARIARS